MYGHKQSVFNKESFPIWHYVVFLKLSFIALIGTVLEESLLLESIIITLSYYVS